MTKVILVQGDITTQRVDAIVNSANSSLLGGGGVDRAIHKAAGPKLLEECKKLDGCRTGEAKISKGYSLPVKYIIHTVGHVYGQENGAESTLLAKCYISSLMLAKKFDIKTIAFPSISTGVYGYPKEEAVKIAYKTIVNFIKNDNSFTEVRFVLHSIEDYQLYSTYWIK